MLAAARERQALAERSLRRLLKKWVPGKIGAVTGSDAMLACGDFARLPLRADSIDIVWSNLALHWHPQPDQVFAEWRRVLRVDGLLMFSCFGPDTFKELRAAFAEIDAAPHALPFVDMHVFGVLLVFVGFSLLVLVLVCVLVSF